MRKNIMMTAATAIMMTTLVVGCGAPAGGANKSGGSTSSNIKVGLVTDTGGLNDHSFNHLADVGLNKAKKQLGVKTSVVQSKSESDYVPNLSHYAQKGYNLVIAVGYLMHGAVEKVSKEYPKTDFLIIDDSITNRPNVTSAIFKSEQAGYLAGALVGILQSTNGLPNLNNKNTVGVIGGQKIPPVDTYIAGFQQGFKKEDSNGKVLLKYTGSFTDQSLGSQYAQTEMSNGADIVFPVAGGCGIGAIDAVKSANLYAIGVDTNQAYLAPKHVITSAMKGVDTSVFDTAKAVKNGTFKSGVNTFGLKNNGVGIAPFMSGVPKSAIDKVNKLKQQIINGKIQVSTKVQGK